MNIHDLDFLKEKIGELKDQGIYRKLPVLETPNEAEVILNGKKVINLSSNNYLGFANHPRLKKASIEAIENVSDYFPIPASLSKGNDTLFMLTISGDSMKNAGILDGDQIVVKQGHSAENSDIVVALTEDNEATVKRFFKEKDHYRLQPENDDYNPILLREVQIIGKVIGVYRNFE